MDSHAKFVFFSRFRLSPKKSKKSPKSWKFLKSSSIIQFLTMEEQKMEEYKNVIRIGIKGSKYSSYKILYSNRIKSVIAVAKKRVVEKTQKRRKTLSKKRRTLKQVLRESNALDAKYGLEDHMSVEVPNSKLPPRKYCDITGYEAKYTDPKSKLRYCSVGVMRLIRSLPENILQKYISIRKGDLGL